MTVTNTGNTNYSLINIGQFKWSIEILQKNRDQYDNSGFPVNGWTTLFKLRCQRKNITTSESTSYNEDTSKMTMQFTCRKRAIDDKMFVKFNGKIFDITNVDEIDDFFIVLTATEYLGE